MNDENFNYFRNFLIKQIESYSSFLLKLQQEKDLSDQRITDFFIFTESLKSLLEIFNRLDSEDLRDFGDINLEKLQNNLGVKFRKYNLKPHERIQAEKINQKVHDLYLENVGEK